MGRILVIGGGVSGLCAAIFSRLSGEEVTICEANENLGGALCGWQREGYHIDNCIHWLTGTNKSSPTYEIWQQVGALGRVPVYQSECLFTYKCAHGEVTLFSDLQKTKTLMLSLSPADSKRTNDFFRGIEAIMGIIGIGGEDFNEKISRVELLRLSPLLLKYCRMSTGELSDKFTHKALRGFLSSILERDFSAIALMLVFANFFGKNAAIPEGSSVAMAKRMTDRLLSLGGEIITGKAAVKINVSKGLARSAQLSDGSIIHADCIICATPPEVTFGVLLGKALPKEYESAYRSKKPSRFSSIHAAFACDVSRLPFKSDLIFEIPEKYRPRLGGRHLVLREFSHEKSFAPEGKSIMQAMVFCGERKAAELITLKNKSPADYRLQKLRIGRDMEKIITAKLPELSGLIKCIDLWTPATYNRYLGTSCGSYMSFILPPSKIPHRRSCRVSGIKNLFLATQWSMPVGGLPIAAGEGKRAAEAAAAYLKLGKKSASPRLYRLKRTPAQ